VNAVARAHVHDRAAAQQLAVGRRRLPHHRDDAARAIAELDAQELAAVALGTRLDVAHEQRLLDVAAVGELADQHRPRR